MAWRTAGRRPSDPTELVDRLDGLFKPIQRLAEASRSMQDAFTADSVQGERESRQVLHAHRPMDDRTADAVSTFADMLDGARDEVRRMNVERHEKLEEAFGLGDTVIAGILSGELQVESADIELSENGGESDA